MFGEDITERRRTDWKTCVVLSHLKERTNVTSEQKSLKRSSFFEKLKVAIKVFAL